MFGEESDGTKKDPMMAIKIKTPFSLNLRVQISMVSLDVKDYLNGVETGVKKPKSNVPALFDKLKFTLFCIQTSDTAF